MRECDRWERKWEKEERETLEKKEKQRKWWHICACVTVRVVASLLTESWVTAHAPDG